MENASYLPDTSQQTQPPPAPSLQDAARQRQMIIIGIVVFIFILAILLGGAIYLMQPTSPTEQIRDVFIIFMALESMVVGLALVILVVQLARLINLLQNEIKPILESTNETMSTLRGTTTFLSENMVEPVIKLNEYLAALQQMFKLVSLGRRRNPNMKSQGE